MPITTTTVTKATVEEYVRFVNEKVSRKFRYNVSTSFQDDMVTEEVESHSYAIFTTELTRNIFWSACLRSLLSGLIGKGKCDEMVTKVSLGELMDFLSVSCFVNSDDEETKDCPQCFFVKSIMSMRVRLECDGQSVCYRTANRNDINVMMNLYEGLVNQEKQAGKREIVIQRERPRLTKHEFLRLNNDFGMVEESEYDRLMELGMKDAPFSANLLNTAARAISKLDVDAGVKKLTSDQVIKMAVIVGKMSAFGLSKWLTNQVLDHGLPMERLDDVFHTFSGIEGVWKDPRGGTEILNTLLTKLGFTMRVESERHLPKQEQSYRNYRKKSIRKSSYKKKNDTNKNRKGSVVDDESHSGNLSIQCGQLCEHIEQLTKAINESTAVKKHEIAQPVLPPDFSVEVGYVTDTRYELHAGKYVRRVFKS
ncbi:hypothetical protein PCE1_000274 [Barthelona sp. PCE]